MGLTTEVLLGNRPLGDFGSINDYLDVTSDNGNDPILADFGLAGYPPTQYQVFIQQTLSAQPRVVWTCPDVNQGYNRVHKAHGGDNNAFLWYSDSATPGTAIGPIKIISTADHWFPKANYLWTTSDDGLAPSGLDPGGQTPVAVPGGHSFVGTVELVDASNNDGDQTANFDSFTAFDMDNLVTGLKLYRKATAFTVDDHFDVSGATLLADVGVLATTQTTAAKAVPGYDTTFDLNVVSTSFRVIGDWVFIPAIGLFQVTGVPSSTKFSLKYLRRDFGPIDPITGKHACDTNTDAVANGTTPIPSGSRVISASFNDTTAAAELDYRLIGVTPDFNYPNNDTQLLASAVPAQLDWAHVLAGVQSDSGNGTVADSNGNVFMVGSTNGNYVYLEKRSATGSLTWYKIFQATGVGHSVSVDTSGDVYITGEYTGSANFGGDWLTGLLGSYSVFVVKINAAGNHVWSKGFPGNNFGRGVSVDTSSGVYVTGGFQSIDFGGGTMSGVSGGSIYVAKLSTVDGSYGWQKQFGASGSQGSGIVVNNAGNLAITGYCVGTTTNFGGGAVSAVADYQVFVAKLSTTDGSHVWSHAYGAMSGNKYGGNAIAIGSSGEYAITGQFVGTINFGGGVMTAGSGLNTDIFFAKLNSAGVYAWQKQVTGSAATSDNGYGAAIDTNGNMVFTGQIYGSANFGLGTISGDTNLSIFLAKYNLSGVCQWAKAYGGNNTGNGCAITTSNKVIATGVWYGTIDFGGGPISGSGGTDGFLIQVFP